MKLFTIDEFTHSRFRNLWIQPHPHLNVYVRKGNHLHPLTKTMLSTFDIANIHVDGDKQGEGIFSTWLSRTENDARRLGYQALHIENVLTDRFATHFKRDTRWIMTSHAVPSFFLVFEEQ